MLPRATEPATGASRGNPKDCAGSSLDMCPPHVNLPYPPVSLISSRSAAPPHSISNDPFDSLPHDIPHPFQTVKERVTIGPHPAADNRPDFSIQRALALEVL